MRRGRPLDVVALLFVSFLVIVPQYYLATVQPDLSWVYFAWAVALPAGVASAVFLALGRREYLFFFFAFLWSVTDDNPVNLDSVYTWPEVTSGLHHTIMEVILHALTLVFLYLAVKETARTARKSTLSRPWTVWTLVLATFVVASVSILPLPSLQAEIATNWYEIDIAAHVLALGLVGATLAEASR